MSNNVQIVNGGRRIELLIRATLTTACATSSLPVLFASWNSSAAISSISLDALPSTTFSEKGMLTFFCYLSSIFHQVLESAAPVIMRTVQSPPVFFERTWTKASRTFSGRKQNYAIRMIIIIIMLSVASYLSLNCSQAIGIWSKVCGSGSCEGPSCSSEHRLKILDEWRGELGE